MAEFTVLARKYRPQLFSEVVGQEHIVKAMKNSIINHSLHSVYLLSGTRGVGKTTLARIFAKSMNCQNFEENQEPCGHCDSCTTALDEDLIEIDGASKTKVEDTRALIETLNHPPVFSKYKVFIIDEVHMLTTQSFNALLKTLEEPPEYAKFLLCTTDPQKIPATVLSRCLHFHLKPYTPNIIAQQLKFILDKENIEFDEKSIVVLSEAANGSLRDCLSLSEQAIAICNRQINYKQVYEMLGLIDDSLAFELVQAILGHNTNNSDSINFENDKLGSYIDTEIDHNFDVILNKLEEISSLQTDWKIVVNQICYVLYQISLFDFIDNKELIKNQIDDHVFQYYSQYAHLNNEFFVQLQNTFDLFINCNKLLEFTTNPYQLVCLTCMRALAFVREEKKKEFLTESISPLANFEPNLKSKFNNLGTKKPISLLPNSETNSKLSFLHELQFSTVKPRNRRFTTKNNVPDLLASEFEVEKQALEQHIQNLSTKNNNNASATDTAKTISNSASGNSEVSTDSLNTSATNGFGKNLDNGSNTSGTSSSNQTSTLFKSVYSQKLNYKTPINTFIRATNENNLVLTNPVDINSNINSNTNINPNQSNNLHNSHNLDNATNMVADSLDNTTNSVITPNHISQNNLSQSNVNLSTEINKVLKNIEFKRTSYYKIYDKYEQSLELIIENNLLKSNSILEQLCLESLLKLYHTNPQLFDSTQYYDESMNIEPHFQVSVDQFIESALVRDKILDNIEVYKLLTDLSLNNDELSILTNKKICLDTEAQTLSIIITDLELDFDDFKQLYDSITKKLASHNYKFIMSKQEEIAQDINLISLSDLAMDYVSTQLNLFLDELKAQLNIILLS